MGARDFFHEAEGHTPKEAFIKARDEAAYDYGHAGYTGTIAEKGSFVMIKVPKGKDPQDYAQELVDKCDHRIDNKWGPAGCILLEEGEENNRYLFFGYASD